MISGAWQRQVSDPRSNGRPRLLDAKRSPLGHLLTFGKGRASFTAAEAAMAFLEANRAGQDVYADAAHRIHDAIQKAVRTGRVKKVGRGVYRLTGEC